MLWWVGEAVVVVGGLGGVWGGWWASGEDLRPWSLRLSSAVAEVKALRPPLPRVMLVGVGGDVRPLWRSRVAVRWAGVWTGAWGGVWAVLWACGRWSIAGGSSQMQESTQEDILVRPPAGLAGTAGRCCGCGGCVGCFGVC